MTGTIVRDKAFWEQYLGERRGTYEFRCIRYGHVLDDLIAKGFAASDSLADVGAGRQEFGRFLREQGHTGEYHAFDGSIDGTDLDLWVPERTFDWMVAIEVIEHLYYPTRMLDCMKAYSDRGFALTTPNPETVDVLGIDRTHVSVIHFQDLVNYGMNVRRATLFSCTNDSLVASFKHPGK